FEKYYRLVNRGSSLAAGAGVTPAGSPLPVHDGTDEQWRLVGVGDDCYKIVNRKSGLVLDVNHGSMAAGAQVIQYSDNGADNQVWRAERVPHSPDGIYRFINRRSGLPLGASPNGASPTGLEQQADDASVTAAPGQEWEAVLAP
ncbi:MAG: RICIN domain-containing protein, partial [Chloroflexi bacterium]|nr:RICIN domain-containing protein [Chloroflexota bacterium]